MGKDSSIEWTDHTFSPWWGCSRVSAGCEHCYAEKLAARWGTKWGKGEPRRFFGPKHWAEPEKWDNQAMKEGVRKRVFCSSMADVCEDREDLLEARGDLMRLIGRTPSLDWLLLTKRPENFMRLFGRRWTDKWPENVWAGTSVENQQMADLRIPLLLQVPAKVRFLSCEPLLGPITFRPTALNTADMLRLSAEQPDGPPLGARPLMLGGIHWVICGGESGPGARPMHPEWARHLQDQCTDAGVAAFFIKQMGGYPNKRDKLEDLPADLRIRQFPEAK